MRLGRYALVIGLFAAAAPARAADPPPVPITIEPFSVRCFDAAALAERIRARMPEGLVRVGAPPAGAHQLVRAREEDDALIVEVTVLDAHRRVVGSERRLLPRDGECGALLETSAQIVIRAATPLHARLDLAPPRPPGRTRRPHPARERALSEPGTETPSPPAAPPVENESPSAASSVPSRSASSASSTSSGSSASSTSSSASSGSPAASASSGPSASSGAPAQSPTSSGPEQSGGAAGPAIARSRPPPRRPHLELDAAALWSFPLDGPPSNPGGELAVGYSWARLGLTARAGVEGESRFSASSSAGPVTVFSRRVPISLELHVDLPVRGGIFRLEAGPLLSLYLARSGGVPHPVSRTLVEPGAELRAAYRLELGRVVLGVGLALDVSFLADDLAIGQVGTVGRTPEVALSPYLSFGTRLF